MGFDIGGTLTDVVVLNDAGRVVSSTKILSLLDRIGSDIAEHLDPLVAGEAIHGLVHGTTIASNAVIEGKTARIGYLTTQGFRDDLEMRAQRRPNIFDVAWDRTPPLVPRELRAEVKERIRSSGAIDQPLDRDHAEEVIRALAAKGVEAIAVCLINSYVNPVHERELRDLIRDVAPDMLCCLSSEIHPEVREYERASTTAMNAALMPVVRRYLDGLKRDLSRHVDRILIMQSNGGIMTDAEAVRRPVYMIESGPAAGVLAAARFAIEGGISNALSFDMGGTTAKACLIRDGAPLEKPGGEIGAGVSMASRMMGGRVSGAGHALQVPSLDIVEVGAGGGSIAWIDRAGVLRVGPESASADPGPVCYARGGTRPTVTDANVVLGYIDPNAIAGNTIALDRDAASAAIAKELAEPLGMGILEVAFGITRVANATMMRALRAVSTERGVDPRTCTLIAFGGAGPLHAADLAASMEIGAVHIPSYPGVFSALGLLLADLRRDHVESVVRPLADVDPDALLAGFTRMENIARREAVEQGTSIDAVRFERWVDLKYDYQISEMTLPWPSASAAGDLRASLTRLFSEAHAREYRYSSDDPIELINLRLRATAVSSNLRVSELRSNASGRKAAPPSRRAAYFGRQGGEVQCQILTRAEISEHLPGPLIVEEPDSTVVVPPGWAIRSDERLGSLVLSRTEQAIT